MYHVPFTANSARTTSPDAAPNRAYEVHGTWYLVPGTANNPMVLAGECGCAEYIYLVLGTLIRPAMISCFSFSSFARTSAGISFSLFASYT